MASYLCMSPVKSKTLLCDCKITKKFPDPDSAFENLRVSSSSHLSGTSLGASAWQTWT